MHEPLQLPCITTETMVAAGLFCSQQPAAFASDIFHDSIVKLL